MQNNEILIRLSKLKKSLNSLMNPDILKKLASLLDAFGPGNRSFVEQFEFWVEKNGSDCRYATMAKEFFLQENASGVAKEICYLYNNWAKFYEKGDLS